MTPRRVVGRQLSDLRERSLRRSMRLRSRPVIRPGIGIDPRSRYPDNGHHRNRAARSVSSDNPITNDAALQDLPSGFRRDGPCAEQILDGRSASMCFSCASSRWSSPRNLLQRITTVVIFASGDCFRFYRVGRHSIRKSGVLTHKRRRPWSRNTDRPCPLLSLKRGARQARHCRQVCRSLRDPLPPRT